MDDLIDQFFSTHFTEEQQNLLYRALGLFNVFGPSDAGNKIATITLRNQEDHIESIVDSIYGVIEETIDQILTKHRLTIVNDPSLSFKVSLLEAIFALGYRDSYKEFEGVIENWMITNEEKFAEIIASVADMNEYDILEHVEWVYEGTMKRLEDLIRKGLKEEEEVPDFEVLRTIRYNLIYFNTAFGIPHALKAILEVDPVKGSTFDSYFTLFKEDIVDLNNFEDTVWRILYLAFISNDGVINPQKLLTEKAEVIFSDLQDQIRFKNMVHKAMGHFASVKSNEK